MKNEIGSKTAEESYEELAAIYDEFRGTDERLYDVTVKKLWILIWLTFMGYKKEDGPFLDLGCGTGTYTLYVAEAGFDCTGVDLSRKMLDIGARKAKEKGLNIEFIKQDISELNLNRQFACIFSNETIVHLEDIGKVKRVFNRFRDHLKPGGVLLLQFCSEAWLKSACSGGDEDYPHFVWKHKGECIHDQRLASLEYTFSFKDGRELVIPMVFKIYAPEEFTPLLAEAGFTDIKFFNAEHESHLENGRVKKVNFFPVKSTTTSIMCTARRGI